MTVTCFRDFAPRLNFFFQFRCAFFLRLIVFFPRVAFFFLIHTFSFFLTCVRGVLRSDWNCYAESFSRGTACGKPAEKTSLLKSYHLSFIQIFFLYSFLFLYLCLRRVVPEILFNFLSVRHRERIYKNGRKVLRKT